MNLKKILNFVTSNNKITNTVMTLFYIGLISLVIHSYFYREAMIKAIVKQNIIYELMLIEMVEDLDRKGDICITTNSKLII